MGRSRMIPDDPGYIPDASRIHVCYNACHTLLCVPYMPYMPIPTLVALCVHKYIPTPVALCINAIRVHTCYTCSYIFIHVRTCYTCSYIFIHVHTCYTCSYIFIHTIHLNTCRKIECMPYIFRGARGRPEAANRYQTLGL